MPQLIISFEGDYPKIIDLTRDEISIGRHSENDIQIPFHFISSFHAQLNKEPSGDYRLTDRDSHNGTSVNGNQLGSALLEDGDQISFGPIHAAYRVGARQVETPKVDTPKTRSLSDRPLRETAPIAVPKPGELQALTEVELQIQLREKTQKQIDKEFQDETGRIEQLKRVAAELEEANAHARAKFEDSARQLEKAEKAAAESQSHMAMREHLVRDLEKARESEQAKFAEAQAGKEALEREQKILQHELGVARKEIEHIKQQIAEGKGAAEKAESAFKQLVGYETKSVRLETEIVTKEKTVSDLTHTLAEKREQLTITEKELEEKRREIHEMGGIRLLELKKEIEDLEISFQKKKSGLENLSDETEKTERKKNELRAELDEAAAKLEESRRARFEEEKQLGENRARLESIVRECEEHAARNSRLAEERKTAEGEIERANRERDEIRAKTEEDRKAASAAETERKKLDALRDRLKEAEDDLGNRKEQLASLEKNLTAKGEALAEAQKSIGNAKEELEELSSVKLVKLRAEGDSIQKEAGEKRVKLEGLKREIEEIEKSRKETETGRVEKTEELKNLKEDCEKRAAELADLVGKTDKLRAERDSAVAELETTRGELEHARIQVDDQKKIEKKIAAELRTLEERKSTNAKLESEIASHRSRLKDLEAELAGRRKSLSQTEKELALREKWLRKSRKGGLFKLSSVFPARNTKNGEGTATPTDSADLNPDDDLAAELADAGTKKENLEQENRKLSQLISEKTAALQKLEEEIAEHHRIDNEVTGGAESPSRALARQFRDDDNDRRSGKGKGKGRSKGRSKGKNKGGVALLNTGSDDNAKVDAGESKAVARKNDDTAACGPKRSGFANVPRKATTTIPRGEHGHGKNGGASSAASAAGAGSVEKEILPLRIIHPRNREMNHYYPDGAGGFDPERHPPIGLHALAACTKGSVHRTAESLPAGEFAALILLGGSLDKDREMIQHVSREIKDKPLLACWREGALDKLAAQLEGGAAFQQFTDMLGSVDGLITIDDRTSSLLSELQVARRCLNIPLPYPVDATNWNFSIPLHERNQAIFVSADGYDQTSADHRARIELVNRTAEKHRLKVTVYHHLPEIIEGLAVPADLLEEPNRTLTYGEFLTMMAKHRFVVGFGTNMAGGEVWGDALLTRNIYLGGHGTMEACLFPGSSFTGKKQNAQEENDLHERIAKLLEDSKAFEESIAETRRLALEMVSFGVVRDRLAGFLGAISSELLTIS